MAADHDVAVRTASGDSLGALWQEIGRQPDEALKVESDATHGALEASALLAAGETRTISIVFAWYFPEHDYAGAALGNYYSLLHNSSVEVAAYVRGNGQEEPLVAAVRDAAALNQVIFASSFPATFQSFLVNSLATQVKNSVWVREQSAMKGLENGRLPGGTARGRYRTYEGLPGSDLDPIHVSDYHMQPLLHFWPNLMKAALPRPSVTHSKQACSPASLSQNTIFTGWAQTQLCPGAPFLALG